MNQQLLNRLSIPALRQLVLQHIKKFSYGIGIGSTLSDLGEIKAEIKEIEQVLMKKEAEEEKNVEKNPRFSNPVRSATDRNPPS